SVVHAGVPQVALAAGRLEREGAAVPAHGDRAAEAPEVGKADREGGGFPEDVLRRYVPGREVRLRDRPLEVQVAAVEHHLEDAAAAPFGRDLAGDVQGLGQEIGGGGPFR